MARPAVESLFLEHSMPGRVRLRVPKPRTAAQVRRVASRIEQTPRVRRVDTNASTGSLLLTFDRDDPINLVLEDLHAIGLEVAEVLDRSPHLRSQSTSAAVVRHVMGRANQKLQAATRGSFDVRLAVPAIYTLLAFRNFMRGRGRLRDAAWYQLLYWAFDSFFKLHEEQTVREVARTHGRLTH